MLMPEVRRNGLTFSWLDFVAPIGIGGIWIATFIWMLKRQPILKAQLRDKPDEVFCCLYLDTRYRLIAFEELFRGTVDTATVHAREVVRQALAHNAVSVIFAHNHPSGVAEPSGADELITRQLKESLALVNVKVLDHIVVGDRRCTSFTERGLL